VTVPDQEIESEIPMTIENDKDVPLLEWLDEDSDEEKFILVQSKKKRKRKVRTSLGSLEKEPYIRRSSRTTPFGHRQILGGGRKILLQKNSKKAKNEFE
jgi:hypothetical protein